MARGRWKMNSHDYAITGEKTKLDVTKLVLVTGVFMYVENGVARYLTGDEQKELVEIIRKKVIE
jgi:hypothetical protein